MATIALSSCEKKEDTASNITVPNHSGGDKISITVTQEATTEDGEIPKPEIPQPSGNGMLTNKTTNLPCYSIILGKTRTWHKTK